MNEKHLTILACIIIPLMLITIPINSFINSLLEDDYSFTISKPVPYPKSKAQEENQPKATVHFELAAQDPRKYGITVQAGDVGPRTQWQWEYYVKNSLKNSDFLSRIDDKLAAGWMKMKPQEFERRMRELNGQIQRYEDIRQKDPSDQTAEKKLETLYMLKSTLAALEEKIVVK